MYFPEEHFGFLYGLSLVPIAASQYLIDPMFQVIINGDDIKGKFSFFQLKKIHFLGE